MKRVEYFAGASPEVWRRRFTGHRRWLRFLLISTLTSRQIGDVEC